MCRGADYVEPAASDVLAAVLAEIRDALAATIKCSPEDVTIGPVDFGEPAEMPRS